MQETSILQAASCINQQKASNLFTFYSISAMQLPTLATHLAILEYVE
jgi:hypothetical protein